MPSLRPFILIAAASGAALLTFALALAWYGMWLDDRDARQWAVSDGYCNIAVVPIAGSIVAFEGDSLYEENAEGVVSTAGDWVARYVRDASYDPSILGIVAEIDSYGGYAAPGYQIMEALRESDLPTLAYIREAGISAGYLATLGADAIIANPFASVGSIGITYSYLQNVQQNEQEGIEFIQLSSGPFKDAGNPNKAITPAERALYERDIEIFNDVFIDLVAASRGLSRDAVAALADGSTLPASLAQEVGLVDAVGDLADVRAWFASELGMSEDRIVLCK